MKNLNLFKSNVSGMDREWIENESGLTRHHGKLWKHVAMIFAVLVMSIANIGMAWGADHLYFWFSKAGDATTNSVTNNENSFFGSTPSGSSTASGSVTIDGTTYTISQRSSNSTPSITFTIPANKTGKLYAIVQGSSSRSVQLKQGGTLIQSITWENSVASHDFDEVEAGTYTVTSSGNVGWCMLAVKVSDATPGTTWYVKGGWNSWGTTDNLKGSGTELSATVNITTAGLYEFKIWNSDDDAWYGNGGNIGCNVSGWIFNQDSNCKFFASETGNYTFTFNTSTKALSVTYPTAQGKYYYKNTSSWGTVSVYRFVGGINNGWPGTQVVETETICGDTYYFTYADPGTTLIFNNNGGGSQTGNMAASGNAGEYVSGTESSWTAFTYNVTYDKNGGTGTAPTDATNYSSGASVPVKDNSNLTKSGYYFAGWNTKADGSGDTYVLGQTFSITSCTTLYAKWNAVSCPDGSVEGTVFKLQMNNVGTTRSLAANEYINTAIYATMTNGSAIFGSTGTTEVTKADPGKLKFGTNAVSLKLNLGCTLQAGDIISFTAGESVELSFAKTSTRVTTPATSSKSYTIPAGSGLIGASTLYFWRASGSTVNVTSLTITRPAGCDAPSALAAATPTAKGITLTVTDANDVNNYEFYVHTSSTTPEAGATATHSVSSAKSLTITNLVAGTTYYAWARTKCSASNKSDWVALGSGGTFTTSTVTMTPSLTNVTHTSGATSGIGGSNYTAVFTASTGYSMPNPTVTIGGNAATSGTHYTWSVDGSVGTITIPANMINGDIAITLNSAKAAPSSVDVSGNYHVYPGETITLTAAVTGGNGPKTYQWYHGGTADGNAIDGATSATYTKASCVVGDAGSYYCKVTCGGTETTTSGAFNVKIMQFYLKNSGGSDISNHALVKGADANHASLALSLTGGTTYKFRVTDGCGNWYGNAGEMTSSNCTNWTMDANADCRITTSSKSATYTFNFDFSGGLLGSEMKVSVVYPAGDQASGKVIYWDNSVLNWDAGDQWYRIGKGNHNNSTQMSLVPGTTNLYKVTTAEYNGFEYWHIGNNEGQGGNIFWTKDNSGSGKEITEAMGFEGSPVTADAVTITPQADHHGTGSSSDNDNCEFYEYDTQTGMKTDRVTISDYSGGTITVNYTNTSGSAATLTSGYADLAHTVILTSITAVADEGYDASAVTINGGDYSANYVVTGATTIAASFTLKTYTISYNKGTNGTGSKASETKTHGVNFTLPGSTFTYGGHAQDGWSTSDGGALAYALSGSYTTNAAQEFFPHWKCNTPSITDNGDNTVSITVPSGTTVRYTTDGTDPSSSTGTVYSTTFSIAADCTVKAIAYQSNCTDSEIASQACDYTAPANFQMIANSSAASDATLALNEYIAQGSKNCVTLTGGTAQYQGASGKTMKVNASNGSGTSKYYGWYFNSSGDKIVVTLSSHVLQVGSVISVEGYGANGNGITANTSTSLVNGTGSQQQWSASHTVVAGDTHLVGKNVITFDRYNSCRIFSITISNCASATPCTTPTLPSLSNQAGCSYSAWNATPSNASTISAAGESISYSWKKGATEKATTASYTPDADGTDYTVTVTVSKAGKISTSVTSSALTATKYAATSISTQPTTAVDATVDVNYTLGSGMVATGEGDLSYQWYSYTSSGGAGEASIGSATSATYTTSKAVAGTYYYKVKVTADCGTVASNMITVTVSEPPCFTFSCSSQSGSISAIASGADIPASTWTTATLTGGTMKNTSSGSLNVNKTYGLVMESGKEVTVTLAAGSALKVGSVITLSAGVSDASGSQTSGLTVSGNACTPASYTSSTAGAPFTQTYTVTALDGLAETNTFTVEMKSDLTKTYLNGITVSNCDDCTPIPVKYISYSSTNIFAYGGTPSVAYVVNMSNPGGGTVTYSSSNTDVATVDSETGLVTAVSPGTTVITATVPEAGGYCAANITKTITVQALVTQTINVGAGSGDGVAWGTAPNMTFDESTIALASMRRVANISNSGYTFDTEALSKENRDGRYMTAKFTGSESSKNASKYLTMKFKNENYRLRLTNVVVPIQPVSSNGKAVVEIYKNGSKVAESSEVTGITQGEITDVTFTLTTPYIVDVNTEIEVRIFFYGQTNGFRLASAILVNGSILRAKQFTGTGNWDDASNWEYHDKPETYHDVDVWNGATLTITGNKTAHDLKVKSGATLNVSTNSGTGITLTLNQLNLEGGITTSATYDMPRVYIDPESSIARSSSTINFDIAVDSRHYWPIALPFNVNIDDVDYANSTLSTASTYGTHYVVKRYDGERRAKVGGDRDNNWVPIPQGEDEVLQAGYGYILTAVKAPAFTTDGGTIRFPMKNVADAWLTKGEQETVDAVTKNKVTVTAWNGDDEKSAARKNKSHKGWNLVGVPYMSCFQTGTGSTSGMPTDGAAILPGKMKVTGEWDEEDDIMYVSIPTSDFSDYIQADITSDETILLPGWCFFVQLDNSGTLTFSKDYETSSTGIDYRAPKAKYTPIAKTGITLSGADASDNTTFLVSDRFSTDYEIGKDLEKMFGENGYTLATYSLIGETKYAYNALSENDIQQVIPIGYRAPAEGEYTFSINPRYAENGAFESVNLIDYETGIVTDLLKFSYTFSTERTQNDTRFALNVVKQKETPTGIENGANGANDANGVRKLLLDGKMYIILDGKMFDAQGKRVQ